jgi:hypothetical protein
MFLAVVYFFFPETRRRTLEDMDAVFVNSKSYLDVVQVAKSMPHASILALENTVLKKGERPDKASAGSEQKVDAAHLEEAR